MYIPYLNNVGEIGKDMFMIERGVALIMKGDRSVHYGTLNPGDYLGESCLLEVTKRMASAFAQGYCSTFVLRRMDFLQVVDDAPSEKATVLENVKLGEIYILCYVSIMIFLDLQRKKEKNAAAARNNPTNSSNVPSPEVSQVSNGANASKSNFHPDSYARLVWGSIMLFVTFYNLIAIPFQIVMAVPEISFLPNYFLDILIFTDLLFRYQKFYVVESGVLITDPRAIRQLFWSSGFSWSYGACIPFDFIALAFLNVSSSNYFITVSNFMSYMRISKLLLVFDLQKNLNSFRILMSKLGISYETFTIIQLLLTVILVGHWAACGFYLFSLMHVNSNFVCPENEDALYGTACNYRMTWVQMQIMTSKLPLNGGTQWEVYLRALNWAIPTLTLEVIDDVFPINTHELLYCFVAMFFGIILNSTIIGTIVSMYSGDAQDTAELEFVRQLLDVHNVNYELEEKVFAHIKFQYSTFGMLNQLQDELFAELPYSLQVSIIENTTLPLLRKCPLFDFLPSEMVVNLCFALKQRIYQNDDIIIKYGEVGIDMFFIEYGSVDVVSANLETIYTTLTAGSYFGESGLVFSDQRVASIRSVGLCICYSLNKKDLDDELRSCEFDVHRTLDALVELLKSNKRRNHAITANLKNAKEKHMKLHKMLEFGKDEGSINYYLKALKSPSSTFRFVWDLLGFVFTLFYMISIPFEIAYFHGDELTIYGPVMLTIGFVVDAFWIVDNIFRSTYFPYPHSYNEKFEEDTDKIREHYIKNEMLLDIIASLPLELFALLSGTSSMLIYFLRVHHLLRARNSYKLLDAVVYHVGHREMK